MYRHALPVYHTDYHHYQNIIGLDSNSSGRDSRILGFRILGYSYSNFRQISGSHNTPTLYKLMLTLYRIMAILSHNVNINVYNVGDEMLQYTHKSTPYDV